MSQIGRREGNYKIPFGLRVKKYCDFFPISVHTKFEFRVPPQYFVYRVFIKSELERDKFLMAAIR